MPLKPQPNRELYLQALRRMTLQQRLAKAFVLSERGKQLLRQGIRTRFPNASEAEIHRIYLERLDRCHNRNY